MDPFYLECELLHPVRTFFERQGYMVKEEVQLGFYWADIVAYKKDHTVAVELKLRSYNKAIVQAKNYQLFVDFVYVTLPLQRVYNVLRKKQQVFEKEGIGLLVVNEQSCTVKIIVPPKTSKRKFISWEWTQGDVQKQLD